MEQVTLYYQQGSSDKVYQAQINELEGGYTVTFAYGRRGSSLKTGTKTARPVDYDKAKDIYDKLVSSKMSKGYTTGEDGTLYSASDKESQVSGIYCQLLNLIDREEARRLCRDDAYCMQEKHDGVRQLLKRDATGVQGINRRGLYVGIPERLEMHAKALSGENFIIDGEGMGETHWAFDVLEIAGEDLRRLPYRERYARLDALLANTGHHGIRLSATAFSTEEKLALLDEMDQRHREGVVIKRIEAPYTAGRPNSGGDQLKFKFYETCSVIVEAPNAGKRSIAVYALEGTNPVALGNVTIPANQDIPEAGDIIEVRYLYAYKGGSLFQPTYLGRREDIPREECRLDQLKYKAED